MRMSEETLTKTAERLGRAREDVREMLSFLDEMFPPDDALQGSPLCSKCGWAKRRDPGTCDSGQHTITKMYR